MSTTAAVVVLFGYRTSTSTPVSTVTATVAAGTDPAASTTATTPAAPRSTAARSSSTSSSVTPDSIVATPTPSSTPSATASTASTRTATGQTEQTRWGPVQVQITVVSGRITAISPLQLPSSNGRDIEINDAAVPVLEQETLQAQSAQIDSVSGATYTSQGYISSLQSALDEAGL